MRWQQVHFERMAGRPGMAGLHRRVTGRPAWPMSIAILTAGAVVILPLLVLLLVALLVGIAVYTVASLMDRLMGGGSARPGATLHSSGGGRPADPNEPLRENVRVMSRPS